MNVLRTTASMAALGALLALCAPVFSEQAKPKAETVSWNQFRGPNRDGLSTDTGLLRQWPAGGPSLAWKATGMGAGYSSVSIFGTRIYTMGEVGNSANIICLNVADGKVVWQAKAGGKSAHGGYAGPRSTPATDGTVVVALTADGDLVCVNAANGGERWRKTMSGFGGQVHSGWGYSESPLLDGNLVVVTPGGNKGTVLALGKANGAVAWQSSQFTDKAAYASLVPAEIGKIPQYIVLTDQSVAGISARDGQVAWKAPRAGQTAVVPTPVYKDGIVFVTSGYGVGCNGFQITATGRQFQARQIYDGKQMVCHHGGVVVVGDHIYGADEGSLKCLELKTGKEVWSNGCVGKGSTTFADGHLVVRGQGSGAIALVEATPTGYKEKGRFDQPNPSKRNEIWPHPVVFGGKMYIRDQDTLYCYDVKSK